MSKKTHGKKTAARKDDGYPFDTGDWEKWSNRKRLDWMINLRDKLRDKYKDKFNISDDRIAQLTADIEALEKGVLAEEYFEADKAARSAGTPREIAKQLAKIIDDLCANNYYKARRIDLTDEQIDQMRADLDKYLADIEAWENRQRANEILGIPRATKPLANQSEDTIRAQPGTTFEDIDKTAFDAALAAGDEETAHREFDEMIEKLEAKAARDPVFAKWFEGFKAEQELLLRWDDTIGEDE